MFIKYQVNAFIILFLGMSWYTNSIFRKWTSKSTPPGQYLPIWETWMSLLQLMMLSHYAREIFSYRKVRCGQWVAWVWHSVSGDYFFCPRKEGSSSHWSNTSCLMSITQIILLFSLPIRAVSSVINQVSWNVSEELTLYMITLNLHKGCILTCAFLHLLCKENTEILGSKNKSWSWIQFEHTICVYKKTFLRAGIFEKVLSWFRFSCALCFLW